MFFNKCYVLPIIPFFTGEKCVIDFTEVKFLCLSKPVLENVLVIFHEFHGNPLEERAINRHIFQVCEAFQAKVGQTKIWESKEQNLLEAIIDHQLNLMST